MQLMTSSSTSLPVERVILVDRDDLPIGSAEKLAAHRDGALHRACSVFVFNTGAQLLLQRRATVKYHSPGLWSNSCCGHPRPGERTVQAAQRRLREEMGVVCALAASAAMLYRAPLGGGLSEHEYDHIFIGLSDATPSLNPDEVDACEWRDLGTLLPDVRDHPDRYTAWFAPALRALIESSAIDALFAPLRRTAIRRMAAQLIPPATTIITVMAARADRHQGAFHDRVQPDARRPSPAHNLIGHA